MADEKERTGATRTEQAQVQLILESVSGVAAFPGTPGAEVLYLYRTATILVRNGFVDAVSTLLADVGFGSRREDDVVLAGVTRMTLSDTDESNADRSVHRALEEVENRLGPHLADLDHLVYVCGHSCAATEPEEVPADAVPVPRPQIGQDATSPASRHGAGVRVLVMDTGLVAGAATTHAWLAGVTGVVEDPLGQDGTIRQDGGHGTFVAGCVRVTAPEASVRVVNAAALLPVEPDQDPIGAVFESDLARLVRDELVARPGEKPVAVPDILVLNFAGTSRTGGPLLAFAALYEDLVAHLKELLILSPAGNEGDERKNWPGSFAWVVSVGGLAENWRDRATWSNFGHNVDVFAPGDRLVNAFATGRYVCAWDAEPHDERHFDGMARWSGTSFATPLVAGLVAARMSSTGQSSRRAWASLLDVAERQAVPGVGPVLYPGQELA